MANAHLILWLSIALLAYTYVGYPALLRLWDEFKGRDNVTGGMQLH